MPVADMRRETTAAYDLILPRDRSGPVVIDSPHSWKGLPKGFEPACSLEDLLTSWDAWVDELFGAAPDLGIPLLSARFPRFFLDVNRARDDIDPELVAGELPFRPRPTGKSAKGFGLLRRQALPGVRVYDKPVPAGFLMESIRTFYDPYHDRLNRLIDETVEYQGKAVHLDCHSMKSRGNAMNDDDGALRPDVVVSDNFGQTSDPAITALLAGLFRKAGLNARINDPYKGAELIRRHGNPEANRHSIQIEINRALYMDETAFAKSADFQAVRNRIGNVLTEFLHEI